jgi:Flp pilus assembly protein TadB
MTDEIIRPKRIYRNKKSVFAKISAILFFLVIFTIAFIFGAMFVILLLSIIAIAGLFFLILWILSRGKSRVYVIKR